MNNKQRKDKASMKKNSDKYKRITITLTPEQLSLLSSVSDRNGYETMSRTIRVLVNKYAERELQEKD